MKKLQNNLAVKAVAVLLFLACITGAAFGCAYVSEHWDRMVGRPFEQSSDYYSVLWDYENKVEMLVYLMSDQNTQGYEYYRQMEIDKLRQQLEPEETNFRYVVRAFHQNEENNGEILLSNTDGQSLEAMKYQLTGEGINGHWMEAYSQEEWEAFQKNNAPEDETDLIPAPTTPVEEVPVDTTEPARETTQLLAPQVVVEYGVLDDMLHRDEFFYAKLEYVNADPFWLCVTLALLAVSAILALFLCYGAGHRNGVEGIHLNWQDRIPYDLYLFVIFWPIFGCIFLFAELRFGTWDWRAEMELLITATAAVAAGCGLCLAAVLTTASRMKARTLLRNTITWRVLSWCGRLVKRIFTAAVDLVAAAVTTLPMTWRAVGAFGVYLLANALLAAWFFERNRFYPFLFLVVLNGAALVILCRWIMQWKSIRQATDQILDGDTNVHIDTERMFYDLAEHADDLNNLSAAIDSAVEQRMKSEHFRTELITNVSHDLKTPLTSIINYVDLLKKEEIDNPRAQEYIEVLDRKSQRLKKLTEDLVEASKASTGNVTVVPAPMDLGEFVRQGAAEYEERLAEKRLHLILRTPEQPVIVRADGRHMWRILDNLLNNCIKYALEGTRVYLEVVEWDGKASISLKNISRELLEGDPERLSERFVRGDESRTTEGSGLGLSIARSLTQVQGGTFRLSTDGDLFKVTVYFPVDKTE